MKRLFDVAASIILLGVMSLPMMLIGLVVRVTMGRPVLYRSIRPGRDGALFTMYKFRTMNDDRDSGGNLTTDAERLTGVGKVLRATSLDELPELINVVRGEMSLVGPRPLLPKYVDRYTPEQARRHEVRPGITGLAQVRGRNAISWEERLELDVWYVDNRSMLLDLRILAETLVSVVRREGISAPGHATMPEFKGPSDSQSSSG